ncbi:GNAT family acetyltransferase [Clostridium sulfidigenes]|uniref:GNAT family acetyltransferase n=1 Tax=Clostridium sulfidigenes TaxID=318464 RepID=A0A084JE77_9CLOT|nr:GNAT family N-acetyltransferase [Clostridium sulfidigenes]KEZ87261.1 GNAT family acetyltransferase [Clostridium sulfidigenes]
MSNYRIIKIQEHPELKNYAANWFHEKWNIPLEAYLESIDECMKNKTPVPQWYIVIIGDKIVGGLGVIENDFHNRKDLTPNVCAVYVEDDYRCQGIAGKMLNYVCDDMREKNIDTLYLVTDHTSFYECHGWEFLCMVQAEGEKNLTRMYIHRTT